MGLISFENLLQVLFDKTSVEYKMNSHMQLEPLLIAIGTPKLCMMNKNGSAVIRFLYLEKQLFSTEDGAPRSEIYCTFSEFIF